MFRREIHLREHEMRGPEAMRGLRVAFLTDIHICGYYTPQRFEPLLRTIEGLGADLVLWGGDYAESKEYQYAFFREIARMKPRLGMYGVLGNNDKECFGSAFPLMRGLAEKAGMRLLINETARIALPGGALYIGGLDEWKHGTPMAKGMFAGADENDFRLLLTHYPHCTDLACAQAAKEPQLSLSGHTHGGQIRVFGLSCYNFGYGKRYVRRSERFFLTGWREMGGVRMLVSNGVGESLLPVRIGAQREIHRITFL